MSSLAKSSFYYELGYAWNSFFTVTFGCYYPKGDNADSGYGSGPVITDVI